MCQENLSSLSSANTRNEEPIAFRIFAQYIPDDCRRDFASRGRMTPINTPITAITTTTSIRVTALYCPLEDTGFILPRTEAKDNSRLLSKEFFLLFDSFTRRREQFRPGFDCLETGMASSELSPP